MRIAIPVDENKHPLNIFGPAPYFLVFNKMSTPVRSVQVDTRRERMLPIYSRKTMWMSS